VTYFNAHLSFTSGYDIFPFDGSSSTLSFKVDTNEVVLVITAFLSEREGSRSLSGSSTFPLIQTDHLDLLALAPSSRSRHHVVEPLVPLPVVVADPLFCFFEKYGQLAEILKRLKRFDISALTQSAPKLPLDGVNE
jgi:hypothetical protein